MLGVKEVQAGLSPEQKLAAIQTAQQQGSSRTGSLRGSGVIMVRSHVLMTSSGRAAFAGCLRGDARCIAPAMRGCVSLHPGA